MPKISRGSIGRSISRSGGRSFKSISRGGRSSSSGWISRGGGVTSRRHTTSRHRSGTFTRHHYPRHRHHYYGRRRSACGAFCFAPLVIIVFVIIIFAVITSDYVLFLPIGIPFFIFVVVGFMIFRAITSYNRSQRTAQGGYQPYDRSKREATSSTSYKQPYVKAQTVPSTSYMYCDNCGAKQKSNYSFCGNCGAPLNN